MVNIGYLPPEEERKLVNFDFKQVKLGKLMKKERIIQLRDTDDKRMTFSSDPSRWTASFAAAASEIA